MKPICGIRTIKGAIALGFIIQVVVLVTRLLSLVSDVENLNMNGSDVALLFGTFVAGTVFLWISIWMLRTCLV